MIARDERDPDHRDPHGRGLRRRHTCRWRARTRACWRSSAPATRRIRTSRRCWRPASSSRSGSRPGAPRAPSDSPPSGRSPSPSSPSEEALRGRRRRLHRDVLGRAGRARRVAEARRARERGRRLPADHARARRRRDGRGPPLFVDRRESCENEAGDYLLAAGGRRDRDGPHHGRARRGARRRAAPGRTSEDEITVFESLGLAVEDLAAAEYIERRASENGVGTNVEF